MSQFCFLSTTGKLSRAEVRRRDAIAAKHGADFNYIREPTGAYKSWFAGPNRGDPFDRNLSAAVAADLQQSGTK